MKYSHEWNIHNIAIFIKYHFKYSLILHVGNHISVKLLVANVPTRCVLQWNVHTLEKERFKKCSIKKSTLKSCQIIVYLFFCLPVVMFVIYNTSSFVQQQRILRALQRPGEFSAKRRLNPLFSPTRIPGRAYQKKCEVMKSQCSWEIVDVFRCGNARVAPQIGQTPVFPRHIWSQTIKPAWNLRK